MLKNRARQRFSHWICGLIFRLNAKHLHSEVLDLIPAEQILDINVSIARGPVKRLVTIFFAASLSSFTIKLFTATGVFVTNESIIGERVLKNMNSGDKSCSLLYCLGINEFVARASIVVIITIVMTWKAHFATMNHISSVGGGLFCHLPLGLWSFLIGFYLYAMVLTAIKCKFGEGTPRCCKFINAYTKKKFEERNTKISLRWRFTIGSIVLFGCIGFLNWFIEPSLNPCSNSYCGDT